MIETRRGKRIHNLSPQPKYNWRFPNDRLANVVGGYGTAAVILILDRR